MMYCNAYKTEINRFIPKYKITKRLFSLALGAAQRAQATLKSIIQLPIKSQ